MWWEYLIVFGLVILSAIFIVQRLRRKFSQSECSEVCENCGGRGQAGCNEK